MTTEHFTLQGARASTIAESTGRATMFLGAVSAGLVALGLMATATQTGRAFYAFALILLPTPSFVGLVTFERVLLSDRRWHGRGDHQRADRLRRRVACRRVVRSVAACRFVVGGVIGTAALVVMMRCQHSAWSQQLAATPFSHSEER
jgi:hypothetical protein